MLMAGLGAAAAVTLAPLAAGVAQAAQVKLTSSTFPTTTTTVVTNETWTSSSTSMTPSTLAECPVSNNGTYDYTTIAGAAWIWANLGQASCTTTNTVTGPGSVAADTVILSTTFTVPGNPQGATLTLAADNGAAVSINGHPVATLTPDTTGSTFRTSHSSLVTATDLAMGPNTITIVGTNSTGSGYNPAGVLAKLTVTSTLNTINLCKHTGWRQWTTPMFQNQGDCVSYFVGNGNDPTIPTP
jgi:hypothetical protein